MYKNIVIIFLVTLLTLAGLMAIGYFELYVELWRGITAIVACGVFVMGVLVLSITIEWFF